MITTLVKGGTPPEHLARVQSTLPANGHAPLKIAMVAPPYFDIPPQAYGGIEAVIADLANALVDLGHQVTVIGAGRDGTRARFWQVWEQAVPERLGEPGPEIIYATLTRRVVENLHAAGEVDVVHDHTFAGPLNAPAYDAMGLPTVVTVHGPVDSELRGYYRTLDRDLSLVAISHRQRALAPELNWVGAVHNGLRPQDWPFQREKKDYALFLGRFSPDKGAHTAVRVAHEAGLPLILAGKCAEPAEKKYFAEHVEPLLGPHDDMIGIADATLKRELLANARCLLFPVQWEEPFGMVMIEAMVCGTPVVALRAGAVPEVVEDGVSGFICDDPGQLPAALRAAVELDPAECREQVVRRFSDERMAMGYVQAYRAALAERRQPRASRGARLAVRSGRLTSAGDR
ncbi:glycosyltransferase family 4 protein [Catellatospora bangladeshensis]|uniref:Glycosyl transferase n=1 Tax=Catellatospora bangladeshensis TaxID=310355 RepID=A0A8J3J9Z8_9ACTN|nr:glycosyltransferase family 4 protein [Catellatospora bangladeshensis]GIF81047.1 glycosyl transferase [Catellatospora bangladeshensis]